MRLELQKLRNVTMSEIGNGGGGMSGMSVGIMVGGVMGDQSPRSFDGRKGPMTQRKAEKKGGILSDNDVNDNLSESDDIQV
jgi:hypothetical protein